MENSSSLLSESSAKDRLFNWIAISVALLAAFMAVTKVKNDNIVQAITREIFSGEGIIGACRMMIRRSMARQTLFDEQGGNAIIKTK